MKPKVGDRIRVVRLPEYPPGSLFHADTKALFRKLIARKRPLTVFEVDQKGWPWVRCRWRRRGRLEYHSLGLDPGTWVRVPAP